MYEKKIETVRENDVYFMETVKDKIIINYGYSGIEVLDYNLKSIRKINIFDDIVMHSTYVNSRSNELLLLCPENECFVYVNLNDYSTKTISFKDNLQNTFFSRIYLWQDDVIIINLYESFVEINLKKESIEIVKDEKVMERHPRFYKFCSCVSGKDMIDVCSINDRVILQNGNGEFFMFSLENNLNKLSIKSTCEITDLAFNEENIALVYGNYVKIIANDNEKTINCEEGYTFLKAAYLENKNLVVLSNNRLQSKQSKVSIFNI